LSGRVRTAAVKENGIEFGRRKVYFGRVYVEERRLVREEGFPDRVRFVVKGAVVFK
jgi:hypothetical protein